MDNNHIIWEPLEKGIMLPRDPHFPYTRDVTLLRNTVMELAGAEGFTEALDIGCGSGAVMLMLAAEYTSAGFTGVDIREGACVLARKGIEKNGLGGRMEAVCGDIREDILKGRRFSLCVSNPPYRKSGKPSPDPERETACGESCGTVADFVRFAYRHCTQNGRFVLIEPAERLPEILSAAKETGFSPEACKLIAVRKEEPPIRAVVSLRKKKCAFRFLPVSFEEHRK